LLTVAVLHDFDGFVQLRAEARVRALLNDDARFAAPLRPLSAMVNLRIHAPRSELSGFSVKIASSHRIVTEFIRHVGKPTHVTDGDVHRDAEAAKAEVARLSALEAPGLSGMCNSRELAR
jgi:hypothetical protein